MTVARAPRLDGDKKPIRAKTMALLESKKRRFVALSLTERNTNHANKLGTITDQH